MRVLFVEFLYPQPPQSSSAVGVIFAVQLLRQPRPPSHVKLHTLAGWYFAGAGTNHRNHRISFPIGWPSLQVSLLTQAWRLQCIFELNENIQLNKKTDFEEPNTLPAVPTSSRVASWSVRGKLANKNARITAQMVVSEETVETPFVSDGKSQQRYFYYFIIPGFWSTAFIAFYSSVCVLLHSAMQACWRWWSTIWAAEVDPLFRGVHINYICHSM